MSKMPLAAERWRASDRVASHVIDSRTARCNAECSDQSIGTGSKAAGLDGSGGTSVTWEAIGDAEREVDSVGAQRARCKLVAESDEAGNSGDDVEILRDSCLVPQCSANGNR